MDVRHEMLAKKVLYTDIHHEYAIISRYCRESACHLEWLLQQVYEAWNARTVGQECLASIGDHEVSRSLFAPGFVMFCSYVICISAPLVDLPSARMTRVIVALER